MPIFMVAFPMADENVNKCFTSAFCIKAKLKYVFIRILIMIQICNSISTYLQNVGGGVISTFELLLLKMS